MILEMEMNSYSSYSSENTWNNIYIDFFSFWKALEFVKLVREKIDYQYNFALLASSNRPDVVEASDKKYVFFLNNVILTIDQFYKLDLSFKTETKFYILEVLCIIGGKV